MVFTCSFCRLLPGENGRRTGGGKLALRDDNIAGVIMLLKQQWPTHAACADQLEAGPGATVCLECMPEEQRSNVTRVVNRKKSVGNPKPDVLTTSTVRSLFWCVPGTQW